MITKELLSQVINQKSILIKQQQQIGTLWAGYGQVYRVKIGVDNEELNLVVKVVKPPISKKQVMDEGHKRKLDSYKVEAFFYEKLAEQVLSGGGCIAKPFGVKFDRENQLILALSDLNAQGFSLEVEELNLDQTCCALKWLACFHATFWEFEGSMEGLWQQGCYWYLDTRQTEYKRMKNKQLKSVASKLDELTKGIGNDGKKSKKFRTIIHGDFKSENMLFNSTTGLCSAYDFQYVGEGYGARDIAYLFCSSVQLKVVEQYEEVLLRYYYDQLMQKLYYKGGTQKQFQFKDLVQQYEFCLADYVRFMDGWGYWGNSTWALARIQQLLSELS
eukprot:TRINITY_DN3282_c0_g1_i9.p1 TRINITY_DN3282_c0_g1~~TRINITY_DN3282_c0_g1_i9.p1  ORF type:complete len:331 (+),score=40.96 TRINITY_DN3282_c0_g1_i9:112-1104(+)